MLYVPWIYLKVRDNIKVSEYRNKKKKDIEAKVYAKKLATIHENLDVDVTCSREPKIRKLRKLRGKRVFFLGSFLVFAHAAWPRGP